MQAVPRCTLLGRAQMPSLILEGSFRGPPHGHGEPSFSLQHQPLPMNLALTEHGARLASASPRLQNINPVFRAKEPNRLVSGSEEVPCSLGRLKTPLPHVCHTRGWPPIPSNRSEFRLIWATHLSPEGWRPRCLAPAGPGWPVQQSQETESPGS